MIRPKPAKFLVHLPNPQAQNEKALPWLFQFSRMLYNDFAYNDIIDIMIDIMIDISEDRAYSANHMQGRSSKTRNAKSKRRPDFNSAPPR